jgi:hypothetical protein
MFDTKAIDSADHQTHFLHGIEQILDRVVRKRHKDTMLTNFVTKCTTSRENLESRTNLC